MARQLTRKAGAVRRRLVGRNTMGFPRELRNAIPDLHGGRLLEIDSIAGRAGNTPWAGPAVELTLVVKETGKLSGRFVLGMSLQVDAARKLAATLSELAGEAGKFRSPQRRAGN
jgi:hypothetical protein